MTNEKWKMENDKWKIEINPRKPTFTYWVVTIRSL
jgi:hypothetical protein